MTEQYPSCEVSELTAISILVVRDVATKLKEMVKSNQGGKKVSSNGKYELKMGIVPYGEHVKTKGISLIVNDINSKRYTEEIKAMLSVTEFGITLQIFRKTEDYEYPYWTLSLSMLNNLNNIDDQLSNINPIMASLMPEIGNALDEGITYFTEKTELSSVLA